MIAFAFALGLIVGTVLACAALVGLVWFTEDAVSATGIMKEGQRW